MGTEVHGVFGFGCFCREHKCRKSEGHTIGGVFLACLGGLCCCLHLYCLKNVGTMLDIPGQCGLLLFEGFFSMTFAVSFRKKIMEELWEFN